MTVSVPEWRVERRTFAVPLRDGAVAEITVGDMYHDDLAHAFITLTDAHTAQWQADYVPTEAASYLVTTRDPMWGDDLLVIAHRDGHLVGAGRAMLSRRGNLNKATVWLEVAAGFRRRGLGSLLLHTLERHTPAARTEFILSVGCNDLGRRAHEAFCSTQGYELAHVTRNSRLVLPLPAERLAEVKALIGSHADGYTVEVFVGGIPDDDLALACHRFQSQVTLEAPHGDLEWETELVSLERYRERCATQAAAGNTRLEALATDSTGTVVAHTLLLADAVPARGLEQCGTYVHPDHRGHRLGLAVKLANLREAGRVCPEHRRVDTNNDPTNTPMMAVNELLGFEPHSHHLLFAKHR